MTEERREYMRNYLREWRKRNPECNSWYCRKWRIMHIEQAKEIQRKYYQKRRDYYIAYAKEYHKRKRQREAMRDDS